MRVERVPESGEWLQVGDQPDIVISTPDRIIAVVDDGSLPWDIRLTIVGDAKTEAHIVEEVTIRRRPEPDAPPASAVGIRHVPLGALLAEAVRRSMTAFRVVGRNDDGTMSLRVSSDDFIEVTPSNVRQAVQGRRKNAVKSEDCAGALELYEQAKKNPGQKDPLGWVAAQLGIGRSTAHKYVKRAREERGEQ